MLEATTKRVGLSFACLALLAGGCRPSTSPSTADKPVVVEDSKPNKLLTANQAELTQDYLGKLLGILNDGKLTAEMLTPSFKSKVAPSRANNDDDRRLGYDPRRLDEFLKKVNVGGYESEFNFLPSATGPFIGGAAKSSDGSKESFVIHLVPVDSGDGWRVNWLHRSKARNNSSPADPGLQLAGAPMLVQMFADNLLGGDLLLAEALLADAWKKSEYPDANAEKGYNQALVQQKLRGWQDGNLDYIYACPEYVIGKPAQFEIVVLDAKNMVKKAFALKVAKATTGDWLIEEIETK